MLPGALFHCDLIGSERKIDPALGGRGMTPRSILAHYFVGFRSGKVLGKLYQEKIEPVL